MKKNGFTLIELIATLVLMSLLATVILLNMVGMKDKQDDDSATSFKRNVEEAACSYVDRQDQMIYRDNRKENGYQLSLSTLIDEGLIDEDYLDKSTNMYAKEERDTVYVLVHWEITKVNNVEFKEKKCDMQRSQ